jgi:sarcosine oxidase subunit beta
VRTLSEPPRSAELAVIGSGIVGAATAFFAARRGLDVVVVDSLPGPCLFTTAVAAGGYRLQLEHEEELGLVRRTVEILEDFGQLTGQDTFTPGLRPQGYLWLTSREEGVAAQRSLVERQRGWGIDGVELLDQDDLRARFGWVPDHVLQARFRQADGLLAPRAAALGLLEGSDARLALGTTVTGFTTAGGRLSGLETSAGPLSVPAAVIACGPLSGTVAALAGVELPVEAVRRHRVVLWDVPEVPADGPMTIDEDTTAHWRPVGAGAYLLFPDPDEPAGEPTWRVEPDHGLAVRLLDPTSPLSMARTARFWRDVWERGAPVWSVQAGQYTMTPDQRPLIGETGVPGLYVNTGYSGHGVMGGPAGGELLAGLIAGEAAAAEPFQLDRVFTPVTQLF